MGAAASGGTLRRFTVSVVAPNFTVLDSGTGATVTTALAAAATQTLNLFTLPGGGAVLLTKAKHRTAFAGGALTSCSVEVGVPADTDRYLPRFNIFQAVADTGVARMLARGGALRAGLAVGVGAAGPITVAGMQAGDRLLASSITDGPQAAFTGAGSNQGGGFAGGEMLEPGIDLESIVTVADQVQQLNAGDISARSIAFLAESGGGAEADADGAAASVVSALFRTAGGAGNVNLLTAGVLDVWMLTIDAPQAALGRG